MIRVLGIDPSTAATGLALPGGSFRTVKPKAGADDKPRRRHELYCALSGLCRELAARELVDVAVMELVLPHGASAHAQIELAKLNGVFQLALFECAIPFVEVNPMSLKRYACNKGTAQKPEIVKAAKNAGARVANDNEADAYWLQRIGWDFYNMTPAEASAMLEPQQISLHDSIDWPRI